MGANNPCSEELITRNVSTALESKSNIQQDEWNWCQKQCQTRCQKLGVSVKYFDGDMQQQQVIMDSDVWQRWTRVNLAEYGQCRTIFWDL